MLNQCIDQNVHRIEINSEIDLFVIHFLSMILPICSMLVMRHFNIYFTEADVMYEAGYVCSIRSC